MNFVEVRRKDNAGIARIRVDAITAVVEVNAVQGEGRSRRTIHALQIQIGTNNYLAVPAPPRFVDFAVTSEKKTTPTAGTLGLSVPSDDTVPTLLITAGALVTPSTVPDGTHQLSFGYNVTYPG